MIPAGCWEELEHRCIGGKRSKTFERLEFYESNEVYKAYPYFSSCVSRARGHAACLDRAHVKVRQVIVEKLRKCELRTIQYANRQADLSYHS